MADETTLLKEARRLGGMIAAQPPVKAYRDLSRQLELDVGARQLLEQFEQTMETLAVKEASGQPIEIAEKQTIQSLQQSVALHPLLKKLIAAQTQYMELMRRVQEAINAGVNGPPVETGSTEADKPSLEKPNPASRLIIPG